MRLTVQQSAEKLGVSYATVRNWVRLGRISDYIIQNRKVLISTAEIQQLKAAIDAGKAPYLRSRRNKLAVSGNAVPEHYLPDKKYLKLTKQLMSVVQQLTFSGQLLMLLELYLRLLKAAGKIDCDQSVARGSLVDHLFNGNLSIGKYGLFADQFSQLATDYTQTDIMHLQQLSMFKLEYHPGIDILGLVYMSICSLKERKAAGSYYTPTVVVKQLINDSSGYLDKELPIILDPCCGSGNFLLQLFIIYRSKLRQLGYTEKHSESKLLTEMLTGYDNDPVAVVLTKMNLSLICNYPNLLDKLRIYCCNTLKFTKGGPKFDLIIGNPPWGYKFTSSATDELAQDYLVAANSSSIESFALFIEWAINNIQENGTISYVLPEAVLTVRLHKTIRRLLVQKCTIRAIVKLGMIFPQVNAPVISLIVNKQKHIHIGNVKIKTNPNRNEYNVPYDCFVGKDHFHIYGSRLDHDIIDCFSKVRVEYLKGNADFALGVVTGNNHQYVLPKPVVGSEPVLIGRDVYLYRLQPGSNYLVYKQHNFQQTAPEKLYRAEEKLVYRFICRNLVFAYDNDQRLTLNSANIVIPRFTQMSIKYVLAVLNSRIAQFCRLVMNPSIKVLRSQLETIPLYVPQADQENIIVSLVDDIMYARNLDYRRFLYEQIDQKLMNYYKIPQHYQTYIRRKSQTVKFL